MAEVKITLTNLVTNESVSVAQSSTQDYVLDSVDWGSIESDRQTSAHPAQIGESVLSVTLGTRDVLIKGWLVNDTGVGISELKRVLSRLVNPLQQLRVGYVSPLSNIGSVYLDVFPLSTVSFGKDAKENNDAFSSFEIEARAYSPLFFSATQKTVNLTSAAQSVSVLGDVDSGFTFSLVASGSVSNPLIRNDYTGEVLKFNYALASGQSFAGSTTPGDRYVQRKYTSGGLSYVENAMRYLDLSSAWLYLSASNSSRNSFKIEATSGVANLTATMQYRPAWLEVQAIE